MRRSRAGRYVQIFTRKGHLSLRHGDRGCFEISDRVESITAGNPQEDLAKTFEPFRGILGDT
jgi:hypothetical protein